MTMIDCRAILQLCERYQDALPPLPLQILRLRYNGKALALPAAVGRQLGISGERVRVLEQKGLRMLHQLQLQEQAGETLLPARMALSLWEPWATLWAAGVKKYETRSWATAYRGEILIHAAS
jgi:Sigma-70, region 4